MDQIATTAPYLKISYGTIALPLTAKNRGSADPDHTHRWTVFVRGAENQDISYAIGKVVFQIHESFVPPIREFTSPPYAVTETGWGVFDIMIEIQLKDKTVPPIRLIHSLKLHPDSTSAPSSSAGSSAGTAERPVVSEHYDEICFNRLPADETLRKALLRGPVADPPPYPHQEHLTVWSEEADLAAIQAARAWVAEREAELQDRIAKGSAEKAMLQKQLDDLGITA